jgi:hypothetical protein
MEGDRAMSQSFSLSADFECMAQAVQDICLALHHAQYSVASSHGEYAAIAAAYRQVVAVSSRWRAEFSGAAPNSEGDLLALRALLLQERATEAVSGFLQLHTQAASPVALCHGAAAAYVRGR